MVNSDRGRILNIIYNNSEHPLLTRDEDVNVMSPEMRENIAKRRALLINHVEPLNDRKKRYYDGFKIGKEASLKIVERVEEMIEDKDHYGSEIRLTKAKDCPHKVVINIGVEAISLNLISCSKAGDIKHKKKVVNLASVLDFTKMNAQDFYELIARETREFFIETGILSFLQTQGCKASVILVVEHTMGKNVSPTIERFKTTVACAIQVDKDDPIIDVDLVDVMNIQFRQNDCPAEIGLVMPCSSACLAATSHMGVNPMPICAISATSGVEVSYAHLNHEEKESKKATKFTSWQLRFDSMRDWFLPNIVDHCFDFNHSGSRGKNSLERVVSGPAMASILRMTMVKIFRSKSPKSFFKSTAVTADDVLRAAFQKDVSVGRDIIKRVMLDSDDMSMLDEYVEVFVDLAKMVCNRTATILASIVIGLAKASGRCHESYGSNSVLIDSLLFSKYNEFATMMGERIKSISELEPSLGDLEIKLTCDASIRGAALSGHAMLEKKPDVLL